VLRRTVDVATGQRHTADVVMMLALSADVVVTGSAKFRNIADVENPSESLVGIASAASQGAVTARDLDTRPVMRAGEVLETVPGMIVSQHSGEGKANQYYLRGFNLDHGTDFSTTVAGVPVNTPTGAHAHGYADASFLIPELVSGVQYKKGPYFADEGDFSAAGAANISYVNHLDGPRVHVSGGNDGWGRVFGAASPKIGEGHLLMALELNHNDGPWVRPDDYSKVNGVLRYTRGDTQNGFSVTGMGYWAEWDATDQIPDRAIASGQISRFGFVDSSDYGKANRQSVAAELQRTHGSSSIRAGGFVLRNALNLFSNFTYVLDDPENGDQFEQEEGRIAAGGRVTYRRLGHFFERHAESAIGAQVRSDWIDPVVLHHTAARQRLSTTREDEVGQTMIGAYAQTEIEWARWVRTTLGLRTDGYRFDVRSDNPANSGEGSDWLVSPKFGAVFGPWSGTELYANAGMGYHSNDARGTVIRIDPSTGDPVEPVTPLVRAKGAEVGLRTVRIRGLQSTVALWYLGLDSELHFVGDAGTTEAGRPSRRVGIEWNNYARINTWLSLDGDLAFTHARFTNDDPGGSAIPGSLDRVIAAGVTVEVSEETELTVSTRRHEVAETRRDPTPLHQGYGGLRRVPHASLRASPRPRASV
jgi:TonB-dependent Receptor Plug Domain/TonB dependent receptor